MSEVSQPRPYQFTIARILWATFWCGVFLGARFVDLPLGGLLSVARLAVLFFSPFLAVGALFGRPWLGLYYGVLTGALLAAAAMLLAAFL